MELGLVPLDLVITECLTSIKMTEPAGDTASSLAHVSANTHDFLLRLCSQPGAALAAKIR